MKKKFRVRRADEFQQIMRNKRFVATGSFVVYTKKKQEEHARVGISVPKKLGNAVVRNKTKRQVREMLRVIHVIEGNFDLIIIVRKKYFTQSYIQNQKDLEKLIKKVKIDSDV
ncbi:ribonuclease P protein component [Erysipelothrix larvae]|uniref:Ribonuclease P protein component n=1 Tax=Erysipelothrix larvae TaxID=1514105 RepID=A0A120JU24_9FIRM|nr:ribonuclease P protein component [Erysipelothrix larvae]AMC94681.1 ribonuclease P protein component [Erysipelothrix larvae]